MPVQYELDAEREFIHTRISGNMTLEDVRAHIDELLADPAVPSRLFVLIDAMGLTSLPSIELVQAASMQIERLRGRVRLDAASVAVPGLAYYGVFRMCQVLLERQFGVTHVSMDLESSREWVLSQRLVLR